MIMNTVDMIEDCFDAVGEVGSVAFEGVEEINSLWQEFLCKIGLGKILGIKK